MIRTRPRKRTLADTALRKALRALIGILNQKLTLNDARWAAFGLNAPGAAVTPSAPTGLQRPPAMAGQVHLTWDTPPGTDHFRCFEKKPGETNFTLVTDTAEAELLLDGQASGTAVQFYATAVNPAGESVLSATLSVAVG